MIDKGATQKHDPLMEARIMLTLKHKNIIKLHVQYPSSPSLFFPPYLSPFPPPTIVVHLAECWERREGEWCDGFTRTLSFYRNRDYYVRGFTKTAPPSPHP